MQGILVPTDTSDGAVELQSARNDGNGGSIAGKLAFLGLGLAVGAGAALAVYRRPLEAMLLIERLKLHALGLRSRERQSAGARVRFWAGGDWSPIALVLVHDPFTASESWHRVMPRIARSFRVLAPDLPGFGRSPEVVNASIPHLARVLAALCVDEGIESAVLVGSSLGGAVALEAALRYPRLVRGLVLEDVMGVASPMPDRSLICHDGRPDVDELLRKTQAEAMPIPGFVRDEMAIRSQRPGLRALLDDAAASGPALLDELSAIDVPTLLLWGDRDGLVSIEDGERLNALIPGSRLVRLSGCGHLPHHEAPGLFHDELMDFLAGPQPEMSDPYDL